MASTIRALKRYFWLVVLTVLTEATTGAVAEPRIEVSEASHRWAAAVVRLQTPTLRGELRQNHTEHCTATLLDTSARPRLLTAWHCIEGQADLTRPPSIEVAQHWYPVRVLSHGGSMQADWAIIRPTRPVPTPPRAITLASDPPHVGQNLIAAGYSRDAGLGSRGAALTAHVGCQVTGSLNNGLETDCRAYRGASGGPVLVTQHDGSTALAGVISAGDSLDRSIIIPVHHLLPRLAR